MKLSKEAKIALSAIVAVIIIYIGIIFLKGINFTKSSNVYFVEMDDVNGLAESAPVLANGVQVGIVSNVKFVSEKQNVLVSVELNKGVKIPNGSVAMLTKEMLGAAKLKIVLGNLKDGFMAVNDTIKGLPSNDLLSAAGAVVPDVQSVLAKIDTLAYNVNLLLTNPTIVNSLYNVQALTQNVERSSRQLPDVMKNVENLSSNLNVLSSNLAETANGLMSDAKSTMSTIQGASHSLSVVGNDVEQKVPLILSSVNQISSNLVQTTDKLNQDNIDEMIKNLTESVKNLNELTAKLAVMMENKDSSFGKLMNDGDVYNKLDSTLENASRLLQDLRENPKRYVHFSLFGKKNK